MKTKIFIATFIVGTLLLCSCGGSSSKNQQAGDLPMINVATNHPRKEIRLQDIATIEYVALETTDNVLLGRMNFLSHVSDKYIVVLEAGGSGDIFIFNRSGKIVSYFNRRGQGGEEYINFSNVILDENTEEVFVFDNQTNRILVYSMSGEYKRTLRFSDDLNIRVGAAFNFDNETMLVYDNALLGHVHNERPYMLLSKKDGSIVYSFDIRLPIRYLNQIAQAIDVGRERMYMPLSIVTPNNKHYGQNFVIANISSDTIYLLAQDRVLIPLLVRTPSVHSSEPRRVLTSLLKTDKFIILRLTTLDFAAAERGRPIPPVTLMYEFETGNTYKVSFVDADLGGSWTPSGSLAPAIGRNMDATLIPVMVFEAAYERNRLNPELESFVATLDEDDNPVVRIITFK
jgi:hypothetical protein